MSFMKFLVLQKMGNHIKNFKRRMKKNIQIGENIMLIPQCALYKLNGVQKKATILFCAPLQIRIHKLCGIKINTNL